jgi:hypothetical protein
MYYPKSPDSVLGIVTDEDFRTLKSSVSKQPTKIRQKILIIDAKDPRSWHALNCLKGFDLCFGTSVHYLLRTGLFQDFSIFAISENSAFISRNDLETLLAARCTGAYSVFDYSYLSKISSSDFLALFDELTAKDKIHSAVSTFLEQRNKESKSSASISCSYRLDSNELSEKHTQLSLLLRETVMRNENSPEEILRSSIKLIRESNKGD